MRSLNMRDVDCEHCPYYYQHTEEELALVVAAGGLDALEQITGQCRANPPAMTGDGASVGFFPTTHKSRWCGHHPDFDI